MACHNTGSADRLGAPSGGGGRDLDPAAVALAMYWWHDEHPREIDDISELAARSVAALRAAGFTITRDQPTSPVVEIELPWPKPPLSLNHRRSYHAEARERRAVRETARWVIRGARLGHHNRIEAGLHYRPARNGRLDEDNPVATAKVCFDALVDEGVVDDDTPRYMRKLMPEIHPAIPDQPSAVWLTVQVLA